MIHAKQALTAILLLFLLSGQALAADPPSLPDELVRSAPEAAAHVDSSDDFGLASGLSALLEEAAETAKSALFSGAKSVALLLTGVVLLGALESLMPEKNALTDHGVAMAGTLWITAVSAGSLNSLIGLGRETVAGLSLLAKALIPALASATAATGSVSGAALRQVATVFFSNLLLTAMDRLLLPAVYLYIGLCAAGAVTPSGALSGLEQLLKKLITWGLSIPLVAFVAYLSLGGAVADAADAQAVKLMRSAVGAAVPVVGAILSDASESLLSSAGLLRSMVGVFGTLAVLGLCLGPFLRLGAQYLLFQGAGLVAQAVGPAPLTALLKKLGDAFGLVLAMTGASAALLLIALASSLSAAIP